MNTWAGWCCTYINLYFSSRIFLLTHNMTGSYLFGAVHKTKGHLVMDKKQKEKLKKCHLQSEGGNNRVTRFENSELFKPLQDSLSIYPEVWCSWSMLQNFAYGRFWLARGSGQWVGWKTKLGGVFFSCIHAAKAKYEWNMQNLTGSPWFPTDGFVLSTGVVLQVICCILLDHFVTSMYILHATEDNF